MTFPYMDWNTSLVVDHFACSAIDRGFKSWFDHCFAVLFESVPNRISVRPAAGRNAAAGAAGRRCCAAICVGHSACPTPCSPGFCVAALPAFQFSSCLRTTCTGGPSQKKT